MEGGIRLRMEHLMWDHWEDFQGEVGHLNKVYMKGYHADEGTAVRSQAERAS